MKNKVAYLILVTICLAFTANAQTKKTEIATFADFNHLVITSQKTSTGNGEASHNAMATLGIQLTHSFHPNFELGIGLGKTAFSYELEVGRSVHELDSKLRFNDRPNFEKAPQELDKVFFDNEYISVPVFAKLRLSNNSSSHFRPYFGMLLNNYLLRHTSSRYDFDSNLGADIVGIFATILTGDDYLIDYDNVTANQRQTIKDYFENNQSSHMLSLNPSIGFEWKFKRVAFGFEPYLSWFIKEAQADLINKQWGGGVRTHFSIRF